MRKQSRLWTQNLSNIGMDKRKYYIGENVHLEKYFLGKINTGKNIVWVKWKSCALGNLYKFGKNVHTLGEVDYEKYTLTSINFINLFVILKSSSNIFLFHNNCEYFRHTYTRRTVASVALLVMTA